MAVIFTSLPLFGMNVTIVLPSASNVFVESNTTPSCVTVIIKSSFLRVISLLPLPSAVQFQSVTFTVEVLCATTFTASISIVVLILATSN